MRGRFKGCVGPGPRFLLNKIEKIGQNLCSEEIDLQKQQKKLILCIGEQIWKNNKRWEQNYIHQGNTRVYVDFVKGRV